MGMIKLLAAPIRGIVRFPLFQLACVIVVILLLQAADEKSVFGQLFDWLDELVDATVRLVAGVLNIKSFTRSWLVSGFMIAYVYLSLLLSLALVRLLIRGIVDFAAWSNVFGLRNAIARERGIAAYRAWVPLERIRPAHIPQDKWEEAFAWPPNNKSPYPPAWLRLLRGVMSYMSVFLIAAILVQIFTPFPTLRWLRQLIELVIGYFTSAPP